MLKKKELKELAMKIAKQEKIAQNKELSEYDRFKAENEIMKLSGKVKNIDDMLLVDEYVQDFLEKI